MKEMHWLPVEARIKFKLILLTWKCLNGLAPIYLSELLQYKEEIYGKRATYIKTLYPPKTNQVTCGDRSFQKGAPDLWNKLPPELRMINKLDTFKSNLKTHLFKQYYEQ